MHHKYYSRFQLLTNNPIWPRHMKWSYSKCLEDFKKLNFEPDFSKSDFTALLCGTSGEITSSLFVEFILSKNKKAKIIILDISEEQVQKSRKALAKEFPDATIEYLIADAKNTGLKNESVNYIETDGFLEYFDSKDLLLLMNEWRRILKKEGFITTRAFASSSIFGKSIDYIRIFIGKHYLGVKLNIHSLKIIKKNINEAGFEVAQGGGTFCPTFKRFSLKINEKKWHI